jgi:hypothetical protein
MGVVGDLVHGVLRPTCRRLYPLCIASGEGHYEGATGELGASALPSGRRGPVSSLGGIPAALVAWVREDLETNRRGRGLVGQRGTARRLGDSGARLPELWSGHCQES